MATDFTPGPPARAKVGIATLAAPNSQSDVEQGRQPRYWNCSHTGHIARDCIAPKQESTGSTRHALPANAKAILSEDLEDIKSCLMYSSEPEENRLMLLK